jgi:hypothetical protein
MAGDLAKRAILQICSSNLMLKDKKLSIQAKDPFVEVVKFAGYPNQLTDVDDVSTFHTKHHEVIQIADDIRKSLDNETARVYCMCPQKYLCL